jgi:hypothetical protein
MIRFDVEQGSPAWFALRLGLPTASNFSRIITPGGKASSQLAGYAHELIAARILGHAVDDESFGFMQRGKVLEKAARNFYEMRNDVEVELVGFMLTDDRQAGASPDGLVGLDGLLEIKVPNAANHVAYLLEAEGIGDNHKPQVQGQLWVAEREWVDTVSYNPELPNALVRSGRDAGYIRTLESQMRKFNDYVGEAMLKLAARGYLELPEVPGLRMPA